MVELSALDVEKLIHLFVQNLTFKVSSNCNKKLDRINFMSCINKFVYPNNIPLLTCHFDHINKKIVQKVNEADKDIKEHNTRCYNHKSSYLKKKKLERITVKNNQQICNANITETVPQWIHGDSLFVKRTSTCLKKSGFIESIAEHTWQEAILNEEYLQLYINNVEFVKNIHVTLYVSSKTLHNVKYHPNIPHNERTSDYQDILMLREHAILCLINPSERAFVYIENNLPIMIQKHLLQGYVHHFDFESNKDYYSALLILSKWAKSLIRHLDTTILHAISFILRCSVYDILILSHCSDNNFL